MTADFFSRRLKGFRFFGGLLLSLSLSITISRGMSLSAAFDPVLATLAQPFRRQADMLLDLRECVATGTKPGRCVTCYFALHQTAAGAIMSHRL